MRIIAHIARQIIPTLCPGCTLCGGSGMVGSGTCPLCNGTGQCGRH